MSAFLLVVVGGNLLQQAGANTSYGASHSCMREVHTPFVQCYADFPHTSLSDHGQNLAMD